MSKLSHIFAFSLGAAAGSVVTWRLLKTTYEQRAREEIESVKARFTVPRTEEPANETANEQVINESLDQKIVEKDLSVREYASMLAEQGYTDYSDQKNNPLSSMEGRAYVIKPEEFGENDDYDCVSLTYYADQVLADDSTDEIIENVDAAVGVESLRHFGEYEPDIVHVRNDLLGCDYEISLDARKYSHKMEE